MKSNLRERTTEVIRSELAQAAFDLLAEAGYDALTVEDLAGRLGISRASFFRYFGSKDEVVVAAMIEPDGVFADALPKASAGSIWQRLRQAVEPSVKSADVAPQQLRARVRLIQSQPTLVARLRRARSPQIGKLTEGLVEQDFSSLAAQTFASAAIAVLDNCWVQWAQENDTSFRQIVDIAFGCLEDAR